MIRQKLLVTSLTLILLITSYSCSKRITSNSKPITNSKSPLSEEKPYLILISLDGFRWDYVEKYHPPNLSSFIENGVKAESLIPSFPTKTFPNHYTIATGLYPDNHGILGNIFYDYKKGVKFNKRNSEMSEDGSFYGGSPIWVEAHKANIITASYFFVGTEANIQGIRPTYYYKFDGTIKNEVRINQAIEWMNLPDKSRPHFMTLYFADMDKAGHRFGATRDDVLEKELLQLDKNLGDLFKGLSATGLPVNIIIVSDHGMIDQSTTNLIPTESIENDDLYMTMDNGSIVNIHPNKSIGVDSVYSYLKQKEDGFRVYKTNETPGFESSPKSKNWGEIQLIPDFGYSFLDQRRIGLIVKNNVKTIGIHGIDSKHKEMHGIFYANGPAFKNDYKISSIKNIHIFPLMCEILGLETSELIDGELSQIKSVLKGEETGTKK